MQVHLSVRPMLFFDVIFLFLGKRGTVPVVRLNSCLCLLFSTVYERLPILTL